MAGTPCEHFEDLIDRSGAVQAQQHRASLNRCEDLVEDLLLTGYVTTAAIETNLADEREAIEQPGKGRDVEGRSGGKITRMNSEAPDQTEITAANHKGCFGKRASDREYLRTLEPGDLSRCHIGGDVRMAVERGQGLLSWPQRRAPPGHAGTGRHPVLYRRLGASPAT